MLEKAKGSKYDEEKNIFINYSFGVGFLDISKSSKAKTETDLEMQHAR